jgi:hypothetical protein
VSGHSKIYHTTDGGESWTVSQVGYFKDYTHIHFVDANIGWISGSEGYMLRTADGGTTWNQVYIGTHQNQNAVYFFDEENGFLVGNGGMLLHTSNGGYTGVSGEKAPTGQISVIPAPNPFHDELSVYCELNHDLLLTIEILDHTGRVISMPVSGIKGTGSARIFFDGSHLSPGVYFIRVISGGQVTIRKVIRV